MSLYVAHCHVIPSRLIYTRSSKTMVLLQVSSNSALLTMVLMQVSSNSAVRSLGIPARAMLARRWQWQVPTSGFHNCKYF